MPYDVGVISNFADRLHRAYSRSGYHEDFVAWLVACESFNKAVGAASAGYWYKRLDQSGWVGDKALLQPYDTSDDQSEVVEWVEDLVWWLHGSLKPWQPETDAEPPEEQLELELKIKMAPNGAIRITFIKSTQPFLDNVWG